MQLVTWYEGLARREKLLVASAAALAVVAIVVMGVIRPLAVSRRTLDEQIVEKRAILGDIERVAARFGQAATSPATGSGGGESLVVLIDRTTRGRGLGAYLKRNEPDGETSIRLRFENVPFDELVDWLIELQGTHGVGVVSANADPAEARGRVSANLQLTRAGSR